MVRNLNYTSEEELKELNADQWMLDLLELNPSYTSWGNHEDYMMEKDIGWASPAEFSSIENGLFGLDELNECVNFYFQLVRNTSKCIDCDGSGYAPEAKKISDTFYDFEHNYRYSWKDKLTEDEIERLVAESRITIDNKYFSRKDDQWFTRGKHIQDVGWEEIPCEKPKMPSPLEMVDYLHDGINRYLLIDQRVKRLGHVLYCETCNGKGRVFTDPKAHVELQLWMLHPRKGCSRGVLISNVEQGDLSTIFTWLKEANQRNTDRFSRIP